MDPKPKVTVQHPGLDDRLVEPGTREEMLRGQRLILAPALPPKAIRHAQLNYVLRAHLAGGYVGATYMLTRTSEDSDFAAATSVRKQGKDPATGTRYLEELAFEVVHTQSQRELTIRAEELSNRGVRRLLAIFVERDEVCEWSVDEHRYVPLDPDGDLVDPTLVRPLPLRAVFDRNHADNAVIDALYSKGNPRLRSIAANAFAEGVRICLGDVER